MFEQMLNCCVCDSVYYNQMSALQKYTIQQTEQRTKVSGRQTSMHKITLALKFSTFLLNTGSKFQSLRSFAFPTTLTETDLMKSDLSSEIFQGFYKTQFTVSSTVGKVASEFASDPRQILEWVAMPSSRGSSKPKDQTRVSCIAGGFCTS